MTVMTPRQQVTYAIRVIVSHALYYAGFLYLHRRIALRRKAVVLMYHRVLTPEQQRRTASQPGLIVDDATFARHVKWLKRHFTILSLDQFQERLTSGRPFDDASCLITFDDGWIDTFENALPVLSAQGVPAVIFLPVNFIGRRNLFTREALTHLLVKAVEQSRRHPGGSAALRARLAPLGLERALDLPDQAPLQGVIALIESHKYANGPAYEELVEALSNELGIVGSDLSDLDTFMDWQQVERMQHSGLAFGGHGADHRVLTQVSPSVVREEIETSKRTLDAKLLRPAQAFSYPGGGWDASVAKTTRDCGYQLAFTIESGHVSCDDDRFSLRRINIHEGMTRSAAMFLARLTGLF